MLIDWASVNWGYVALLSGFTFIAALIGNFITFRHRLAGDPSQRKGDTLGYQELLLFTVCPFPGPRRSVEAVGDRSRSPECGERPYSFVVHGLWPQFERGFPKSCQVPAPRLPRRIVEAA